jgi:hypothetical protein
MKSVAIALIFSIFTLSAADAFARPAVAASAAKSQEAETWRRVAEAIPLGTKVKIQTTDGKRVSGTLMRVDTASVMVKKNTRLPEPAIVVPFDTVANLEKDTGSNVNVARAILIGAGVGAGVLLTMFAIALQLD